MSNQKPTSAAYSAGYRDGFFGSARKSQPDPNDPLFSYQYSTGYMDGSTEKVKGNTFSIYDAAVGMGLNIANHCSDLYIEVETRSTELVSKYCESTHSKVTTFRGNDGKQYYDVVFAYSPYWRSKQRPHGTAHWQKPQEIAPLLTSTTNDLTRP